MGTMQLPFSFCRPVPASRLPPPASAVTTRPEAGCDERAPSPGPIFCLLLGVSSDCAQPITGQVTEVTCPVIGCAQSELTPSKRQKTGPVPVDIAPESIATPPAAPGVKEKQPRDKRQWQSDYKVLTLPMGWIQRGEKCHVLRPMLKAKQPTIWATVGCSNFR